MASPRKYLIIQGPLHSRYTNRRPDEHALDVLNLDGTPVYDCHNNIAAIVRTFGPLFDAVVISTWDDVELEPRPEFSAANVKLLRLPAKEVQHLRTYNRQVAGVLQGQAAIEGLHDADLVVKTRTDLFFDLSTLVEHARRANEQYSGWLQAGQLGFIHAPQSQGPYHLGDMFVVAHSADFRRFWEASLPERRSISTPSIHETLPIEYAWQNQARLGIDRKWFYDLFKWYSPWHRSDRHLRNAKLWRYLMQHCFCLAPDIPAESFLWRGMHDVHQSSRKRLKRTHFFDEWQLMVENPDAIVRIIDHSYFEKSRPVDLRSMFSNWLRAENIRCQILGATSISRLLRRLSRS